MFDHLKEANLRSIQKNLSKVNDLDRYYRRQREEKWENALSRAWISILFN